MLDDKSFQKGFLVIQILNLILVGAFTIPFAADIFEDYSKLPQFPIWVIEIFFAILIITIIVVAYKLSKINNNKLKFAHLILAICNIGVFLLQISFCILRMSGN